jgi:integrase
VCCAHRFRRTAYCRESRGDAYGARSSVGNDPPDHTVVAAGASGRRRYRDTDSGKERRHHIHELAVRRAMQHTVQGAGIVQRATCHTLRRSLATDLLEDGSDTRELQELRGRPGVSSTMTDTRILHCGPLEERRPADRLRGG